MRGSAGDAGEVTGGAEGTRWQHLVREHLSQNVNGPPVPFGELIDLIGPLIPRHESERHWHQRHPNETELVAPNRKIHAALQRELTRYVLEVFGTERAHGRQWTRETRVRAIARPCAYCGEAFVGPRPTVCCSASHASKLRRGTEPLAVVEHQKEGGDMALPPKHPEIVALDAIYEALRRLPDRETRQRVITYATHLVETEDQAPPPALRVVAQESAD